MRLPQGREIPEELQNILKSVCAALMVDVKKTITPTREKRYREARHIYSYLAAKHTEYKLSEIGEAINRDHATVLHGQKTVKNDMVIDCDLRSMIDYIESDGSLDLLLRRRAMLEEQLEEVNNKIKQITDESN